MWRNKWTPLILLVLWISSGELKRNNRHASAWVARSDVSVVVSVVVVSVSVVDVAIVSVVIAPSLVHIIGYLAFRDKIWR